MQADARILITGGSGFLGINLIRSLLRRGSRDIVSLDIQPFDYPERDRIRPILGDIRDGAAVREAMRGVRQVVHAAAALPLYPAREIESIDINGTRHVLEAAREAGVERVVHISSTAVYGIPDYAPVKEDDPLIGVGPYGKAKIAAEVECRRAREAGLCVPIIRPKTFVGPERLGVFALLYDWARDGRHFPMIGSGRNRYQLLDVEDLCDAIHLCLTLDRDTVNEVFNVGALVFDTMREDYQAVLDHAGRGRRVIPLPAWPVIGTLRFLEALHLSPLYRWVYETAWRDSIVDCERATRVLGWTPRYSNRDALIRNYEWYLANLESFQHRDGVSHRVPWKQGILGLVKRFF